MSGGLPEDVLLKIFSTLEVCDLIRAGSVCSSWQHAYTCLLKLRLWKQPQTPCLLYTAKSSGANVAGLYSLAENRPYTFAVPDPPIRSRYLIGSAYGWIITADERSELHLLNPITGDQIALPSVTTIEQVTPIYDRNGAVDKYEYSWYTGVDDFLDPPSIFALHMLRDYLFDKAFLSADPSSTGDYIVVLIHNPRAQLSFARGGDEYWTWLPLDAYYVDCIFKDDLLYALTEGGEIHAYNLSSPAVKQQFVIEEAKGLIPLKMYIVQAPCGDLLQIWKERESIEESEDGPEPDLNALEEDEDFSEPELDLVPHIRFSTLFKVYRVDLTAKKLVEINSLGESVLCLGHNQSFCLCAKEYPQLKANHVYFTDDCEYNAFGDKNKRRNMGVLNLDNNSIEEIISPRIWSNWPAPLWIIPNPRKMNMALHN